MAEAKERSEEVRLKPRSLDRMTNGQGSPGLPRVDAFLIAESPAEGLTEQDRQSR